ncbi:hypothetical protein [Azohydromonas australica]|uniref:hypothetical protein n=1 Tax=Azohydromonas australica TaxID=364039 RepID=UPI00040961B6|nr:hypothetical protein [Azohydromonas australica]
MNGNAPQLTREALLCGAIELGLRLSHRESDRSAELRGITTLFAVDVDVLSAYANPHNNAGYVAFTGLLDPPASQVFGRGARGSVSPSMVGLAEMLGRYLFRDDQAGNPKVLLEPLESEFFDVLSAIEHKYIVEVQQTLSNYEAEKRNLTKVVEQYLRAPQLSAISFVEQLASQLEKTLPALYGRYNAGREVHRLGELLRVDDGRLLFSRNCGEIADALTETQRSPVASKQLDEIRRMWTAAVNETLPRENFERDGSHSKTLSSRGAARREIKRMHDAEVMAQVEWLNRFFAEHMIPIRVCFLTGASRLCSAALRRFHKVQNHRTRAPRWGTHKSLNFGRYLALAGPLDGLPDPRARDCIDSLSWAPIRDLRSFIVDDTFVDFAAAANQKAPECSMGDGLARWLPVFFSEASGPMAGVHGKLAASYQKLHDLPEAISGMQKSFLHANSLSDKAYAELEQRFADYVRLVGASHAVERGVRHRVLADIGKIFSGQDPARLLGEHLRAEMSRFIQKISASVIPHLQSNNESQQGEKLVPTRGVPPLILTRFGEVEELTSQVLYQLRNRTTSISHFIEEVEQRFKEITQKYTEQEQLYLWLLCKALVFAVYGEWRAAYTLATQAFTVSQLELMHTGEDDGMPPLAAERKITGREALYLCHVTARRQPQDSRWWLFETQRWQTLWTSAFQKERPDLERKGLQTLADFHFLRMRAEHIAMRLTVMLSSSAEANADVLVERTPSEEPRFMVEVEDVLKQLRADTMLEAIAKTSSSAVASHCYVQRQCLVNLLQFQILSTRPKSTPPASNDAICDWVKQLKANIEQPPHTVTHMLCPSQLDLLVMRCGEVLSGSMSANGTDSPEFPISTMPYDSWRFDRYRLLLKSHDLAGTTDAEKA